MEHDQAASLPSLEVAVFGVGAVGGYFGGALARAGHDVTFISRGPTAAAMRRDGLIVESTAGDFRIVPATVSEDTVSVGPVDLVVLGVKAGQVPEVAPQLSPLLGDNTAVLPLQNGVEAADQLSEVLGRRHVIGGLCKIFCFQVGPGHVRHAGAEPWVGLGELDNRVSERIETIRRAFEGAGVAAQVADDINAAIWSKFLFIAAVSGVGAATRVPMGEVRGEPLTRQLLIECMREVEGLAAELGISLDENIVSSTLDFVDSLPAEATPSMQRDIAEGRPSELDAQLGAAVRFADSRGVNLSVLRTLYAALLPLERRARAQANA